MQNDWTVIVDDDCGNCRAYYLTAPDPNSAARFAERVYNAHSGIGGKVQYVIAGEPDFQAFDGYKPPEVIHLYLMDTDLPAKEPA
jgi:hypothetical protein